MEKEASQNSKYFISILAVLIILSLGLFAYSYNTNAKTTGNVISGTTNTDSTSELTGTYTLTIPTSRAISAGDAIAVTCYNYDKLISGTCGSAPNSTGNRVWNEYSWQCNYSSAAPAQLITITCLNMSYLRNFVDNRKDKYDLSCVSGVSGLNYAFCCKMNVSDGASTCKFATKTVGNAFSNPIAQFSASFYAPSVFKITCAEGSNNFNFPYCCRTNTLTGTTECKIYKDAVWKDVPAPF